MQFFRQFLGFYGNGYPEVMVNHRNETFFTSTRLHASQDCSSVAMSFADGNYTVTPHMDISNVTEHGDLADPVHLVLQNTTLWFSRTPEATKSSVVISAAEESLGESWELLEAFGADRSPNNTAFFSDFGWLPAYGLLKMTPPHGNGPPRRDRLGRRQ